MVFQVKESANELRKLYEQIEVAQSKGQQLRDTLRDAAKGVQSICSGKTHRKLLTTLKRQVAMAEESASLTQACSRSVQIQATSVADHVATIDRHNTMVTGLVGASQRMLEDITQLRSRYESLSSEPLATSDEIQISLTQLSSVVSNIETRLAELEGSSGKDLFCGHLTDVHPCLDEDETSVSGKALFCGHLTDIPPGLDDDENSDDVVENRVKLVEESINDDRQEGVPCIAEVSSTPPTHDALYDWRVVRCDGDDSYDIEGIVRDDTRPGVEDYCSFSLPLFIDHTTLSRGCIVNLGGRHTFILDISEEECWEVNNLCQ